MQSFPIKHPLDNNTDSWAIDSIRDMFPTFCDNLYESKDIIYSRKLGIFKNAKILLIGGGPSANLISRNLCHSYDKLWSMNNFFMSTRITNKPISMAMFGANTDLSSPLLGEYIYKQQPFLVFEPHPKYGFVKTQGHKDNLDWMNARDIINGKDYPFLKCVCQTAYWSRIGIGARMILLAAHLGVKSIDFIGIDGFSSYKTGKHFFEKDKGPEALPSSIKILASQAMDSELRKEYLVLKGILKNFPIKIKNLASDHPDNSVKELLDQ